jgi:hypothetical protein
VTARATVSVASVDPSSTADPVIDENAKARLRALRASLAVLALIALLALFFTHRIPTEQPASQL